MREGKGREGKTKTRVATRGVGLPTRRRRRWRTGMGTGPYGRGGLEGIGKEGKIKGMQGKGRGVNEPGGNGGQGKGRKDK